MIPASNEPWSVVSAVLDGHDATVRFGEWLGRACVDGDVLALCGPLAAGKTTLAQGLARGLEVPPAQRVRSPTFALCNEYPGRLPVLHADLYRLEAAEEAEDLGFREQVGSHGVAIIEWADRFPEILPLHSLWLRLDHDGERRRLRVWLGAEDGDSRWVARLPAPGVDVEWSRGTELAPWEQASSY